MASASLETVAWLADSPDTLYKVGQALGLPGGAPLQPRFLNSLITYAGTHIHINIPVKTLPHVDGHGSGSNE